MKVKFYLLHTFNVFNSSINNTNYYNKDIESLKLELSKKLKNNDKKFVKDNFNYHEDIPYKDLVTSFIKENNLNLVSCSLYKRDGFQEIIYYLDNVTIDDCLLLNEEFLDILTESTFPFLEYKDVLVFFKPANYMEQNHVN